MTKTYITYKFYNSKAERLTIYYNGNGKVIVVPCTKDDQFTKAIGRILCANDLILLPSKKDFNISFYNQKDFLNWCKLNYFKLRTEYQTILFKPFKTKIIHLKTSTVIERTFLYK